MKFELTTKNGKTFKIDKDEKEIILHLSKTTTNYLYELSNCEFNIDEIADIVPILIQNNDFKIQVRPIKD